MLKKEELKKYLEKELYNQYTYMNSFKNDENPQIQELYFKCIGAYEALDEIYYKSFHTYFKPEKYKSEA